jgi:hypothetical protein
MSTEIIQGSTTAIKGKSVAIKASGVFADNGTLELSDDRVDWRFVDAVDVPRGPWKRLVTTQGVLE